VVDWLFPKVSGWTTRSISSLIRASRTEDRPLRLAATVPLTTD